MIKKIINNWKYIAVALLVIAVIAGFWLAYKNYNDMQAEKQKNNLISSSKNNFKDTDAVHYRDTSGNDHYKAPAGQHTYSQATIKQNPGVSLGGADTAAHVLKLQRSQIEYWQEIALQSKGEHLKALKLIDSLKQKVLYYKDKFIEIAYHPGKDSADNGSFDYKNNESLTILQYWKKSWILGAKRSFIDISSNNPHTSIEGLKTLTIVPNVPQFNIHGQIRTVYDFADGIITPSAGIEVNIGRFDLAGHYYYNQRYQKLKPVVSATYNFFNLH